MLGTVPVPITLVVQIFRTLDNHYQKLDVDNMLQLEVNDCRPQSSGLSATITLKHMDEPDKEEVLLYFSEIIETE